MARATTRVEDVYRRLRTDILSGRHRPGARLMTEALCQRYDTSSGVLREVLPRLAGEGLVIAEPQRGVRVIEVSLDDLRQLTEARVLVESAALRQAIEHGDLGWESAVLAAHHTLARSPTFDDSGAIRDEWLRAHANFHHALLAGCPNVRLQMLASQLRDATEVYRCWAGPLGDEPDRDVAGEHRRVMEATVTRDADLAVAELTAHYEHTRDILLRSASHDVTRTEAG